MGTLKINRAKIAFYGNVKKTAFIKAAFLSKTIDKG
jgi:hypothetical protein